MDSGRDPELVCDALDIAPSVLPRWCRAFSAKGLTFFGLKDYSQRDGYLSIAQEEALKKHFADHSPLNAAEIGAYILAKYHDTFEAFTDAIFEFIEQKTLPENWELFRNTITDNFRVISTNQYKII